MDTPFILSDESVNSYGFWVVTSGIDLKVFKRNPVMLYDHRSYSMLPIGKWNDLSKNENGQLTAMPEFDADDDEAVKIQKKVDKGYLRGCSIGIDIIETSDDPKLSKPGQRRPTVTKCSIFEASVTPLPSNANALKLRFKGETVTLNSETTDEDIDKVLPRTELKKENDNPKNDNSMKKIALHVGLAEDATEDQIMAKLTKNDESATEKLVDKLVELGRAAGTVNDNNVEKVKRLAKADFELACEMYLQKAKGEDQGKGEGKETKGEMIKDVLKKSKSEKKAELSDKKWEDLSEDEVETLRDEDQETYVKLFKAHYGFEPVIED